MTMAQDDILQCQRGSFAIRTPIPFNEFTTHEPNLGETSHVVGGKSSEGIKFATIESPVTSETPTDLSVASPLVNSITNVSDTLFTEYRVCHCA